MFTCHCCQRFIYVNKLSCTTDEGLTTENFGSYHYTILHQNRTLAVINGRVFAKLDEIRRNLAILPLHWESRPRVLREQVGEFGHYWVR